MMNSTFTLVYNFYSNTGTQTTTRSGNRLNNNINSYSPTGVKNFYHEPESPSRALLMDHLSVWYLLSM